MSPEEKKSDVGVARSIGAEINAQIGQFQFDDNRLITIYCVFDYYIIHLSDYNNAWPYAQWKYSISTSDLSITYDSTLAAGYRATTYSYSTNFRPKTCLLGPGAFSSGEWGCASVLGHEEVHGTQDYWYIKTYPNQNEEVAYAWELDHSNAPSCKSTPTTYIYDYASSFYSNAKTQYASYGGTVTYP